MSHKTAPFFLGAKGKEARLRDIIVGVEKTPERNRDLTGQSGGALRLTVNFFITRKWMKT